MTGAYDKLHYAELELPIVIGVASSGIVLTLAVNSKIVQDWKSDTFDNW